MNEQILAKAYQAFNARDIDAVLCVMYPDVVWANGMDRAACVITGAISGA